MANDRNLINGELDCVLTMGNFVLLVIKAHLVTFLSSLHHRGISDLLFYQLHKSNSIKVTQRAVQKGLHVYLVILLKS